MNTKVDLKYMVEDQKELVRLQEEVTRAQTAVKLKAEKTGSFHKKPEIPPGLRVEKSTGRTWNLFYLAQDGSPLLMMEDFPSKAVAVQVAARFAGFDNTRPPGEAAGDRQMQLLTHLIQAELHPEYVDTLRGYVKALRDVTPEQEKEQARQKVREDFEYMPTAKWFRWGAYWREESEKLALGIRHTHGERMREQLAYVESHLGLNAREAV